MQILCVTIYSLDGQRRDVEFIPGALNIITGDSKTGKSALLSIVDYCLGRKSSSIPQTEPFKKISWYSLLLEFSDGSRCVSARKAPRPGKTSSQAMLEFGGQSLGNPSFEYLRINTDTDSLRTQIGARIHLGDVRLEPNEYSSRGPVAIGLGSAVPFALQEQHEIDSKSLLFHRQSEPGMAVALRDSLPFFLGAVDSDQASKRAQLREARARLRRFDAELSAREQERAEWAAQLSELIAEAKSVHLINKVEDDDPLSTLTRIRFEPARIEIPDDADLKAQDARRAGDSARTELYSQLDSLIAHRDLLLDERDSVGGYDTSLLAQAGRLSALNLFSTGSDDSSCCPVCNQELIVEDPTVELMNARLRELRAELEGVSADRPKSQKAVRDLDDAILSTRRRISMFDASLKIYDNTRDSQSLGSAQEFVRGRVDASLERARQFNDDGLRKAREERGIAVAMVQELEDELGGGVARENLISRLNVLSRILGEYVAKLNLEQAGDPIRLDVERLTIVVDTRSGPLPLQNIGSGENWVGYHVAAHLALHEFFIGSERPLPRFLMIDQPSKAHFQSDQPLDGDDPDRETVRNMFKVFAGFSQLHGSAFQLIVVDHANYEDRWFQDSVRHNWRHGSVLIPEDWTAPEAN